MKNLLIIPFYFLSCFIGFAQNKDIDDEITNVLNEAKNIKIVTYNGSLDQSKWSIDLNYFAIDTVLNQMIYAIETNINYEKGGSVKQVFIKDDKIFKLIITYFNRQGIIRTSSYWIDGKMDIEKGLFIEDLPYQDYLKAGNVKSNNDDYFTIHDIGLQHDSKFAHEMVGIIEHCRNNNLRIDSFLNNEIKN
jgi:hypothetical protein